MNWSFIICTHDPNQEKIDSSICTIEDLRIPNYEIIVVGGKRHSPLPNVRFLTFDETTKGWLTKKKNDAAKIAKYENLCICHDYFAFDYEWYSGWLKRNTEINDWQVASNQIKLINGARDWADWISWDHPEVAQGRGISYNDQSNTNKQFIAGHYFVVKKDFFLKNLLDETLIQNEQEDVEWSLRIRNNAKIIFNPYSTVRHLKNHRHMRFWRKRSL